MNFLLLNLTIALLFTGISALFMGVFVLFKSNGNKTNKIFAFYSFSIAFWALFQSITINISDSILDLYLFRFQFVAVWFIPTLFVHFIVLFLNIKNRWILKGAYSLTFVFIIFTFTKYLLKSMTPIFYLKNWGDPGIVFHFAFAFFIISATYALYKLFKAQKESSGTRRNQIAYLFWSSLTGYIGGGANFLFFYDINIPILMPFGTYFVGFYVITVTYAILKFQLMDIKIAIKRTLIYSLGISLISGAMIAVSFLSNLLVNIIPGFNYWLVPLFIGSVSFILGRIFWNKSREVDKLKYEFITIAAHKLRTPITEIKWAVEAAKDIQDNKEKNKLFSDIEKANSRLLTLTDDLLMISKLESAKNEYKLEKNDLEKITREVVNDYQRRMKEKNIKLVYSAEKDLPPVNIDKIRISSVIQILLENAIAYTKNEIKINIDAYKDKALFHIEDNGIGVNKEDQPYIFSNFYRSHDAYLSETEGAGINLFLAKNIIEKHNGKIGVRSKGKDRGSVFWFELPVEI